MAKIIAIANQKGGVGKTTTCVNLTASLAALEQRVLLIDLDPQGNATMGSGIDKLNLSATISDVLLDEISISEIITATAAGYALAPANSDLTIAEVSLLDMENREHRLSEVLSNLQDDYDYIFLDCPPSLNMLTVNALVAAEGVLIPMQCEYYALEGLSSLLETIKNIKEKVNPKLVVTGILRTLYDGRNSLATQVSTELLAHFNDQVYNTIIPRNVRLAEAPSHGLPALLYDRFSPGAAAYLALAKEFLLQDNKEVVSSAKTDTIPVLLKQRSQ